MPRTAVRELGHTGKTRGCADHDHDLIHELSKRLDAVWRYDQYIANAEGHATLQNFWQEVKQQDLENIERLKELITDEIQLGCF